MWAEFVSNNDFPSLGESALDDEHGQIAHKLTELYDAILTDKPVAELKNLYNALLLFFQMNCRHEETMMEHDLFPRTAHHKVAHIAIYRLIRELSDVDKVVSTHDALVSLLNLRRTLSEHTQAEDAQIVMWHRSQTFPFSVSRKF
jgi:hemerythrin